MQSLLLAFPLQQQLQLFLRSLEQQPLLQIHHLQVTHYHRQQHQARTIPYLLLCLLPEHHLIAHLPLAPLQEPLPVHHVAEAIPLAPPSTLHGLQPESENNQDEFLKMARIHDGFHRNSQMPPATTALPVLLSQEIYYLLGVFYSGSHSHIQPVYYRQ